MQTNDRTGFEPLPKDVLADAQRAKNEKDLAFILNRAPRPTMYLGEIVEVKGMKFRVTRIKADGKVGLKMVP